LGFPEPWVYESAFGSDKYEEAIASRCYDSPLNHLQDPDLDLERAELKEFLRREPTEEEFVMYLNQPADALKTFRFRQNFGDPNNLPLDVWFEGLEPNRPVAFTDSQGKPHQINILGIQQKDSHDQVLVRYVLDSEIMGHSVNVGGVTPVTSLGSVPGAAPEAQKGNPFHIAAPMNGDLWVMYVKEGDVVHEGQELFNLSIMKQEKAVLAKVPGLVKKVHKTADFQSTKQMVPVRAGELIVELAPVPPVCGKCGKFLPLDRTISFCPFCGGDVYDDVTPEGNVTEPGSLQPN
jgi:pyruvate carboxylase